MSMLLEPLKKYFGYDSFRQGQEELITAIMAKQDVLGIMPTGGGKSACYQLPAILNDGICLVISPLISLMQDQVNSLIQAGIKAAYINSSLSMRQIDRVLEQAANNAYKLIYIAPERLMSSDFIYFAQNAQISMITIDEAHCISQWGQDFRPSYAQIPQFIAKLKSRPVISAFTATATLRVRQDIAELLALNNPFILISGFDRQNLFLEIIRPQKKQDALHQFLSGIKHNSGIIYCSTRNNVELIYTYLLKSGFNATRYHAGLTDNERKQNQDDFLYDRRQIMVATNAFGMGIDKSNIQFVVHYNMPKDLESYYQEIGRAGRDGSPAHCLLLYSGQDVHTNQWLIEHGHDNIDPESAQAKELKEREYSRLKQITFYATGSKCLRNFILTYFGETAPKNCNNCSNCLANFTELDITEDAQMIFSCIYRMKERFGITMIIDVLRGSKSERLLSAGLNRLSTYNISRRSAAELRAIIDFLLCEGYLAKTDEQYSVIKLQAKASDVLYHDKKLSMKMAIPDKKATKSTKSSKSKAGSGGSGSGSLSTGLASELDADRAQLFEQLRALRFSLASEQSVPAFVVFSDRTLTDMCAKMPKNQQQFLGVHGVGEQKAARYGEAFLEVIRDFIDNN